MNFLEFCNNSGEIDRQELSVNDTFVITFKNRNLATHSLDPEVAVNFIKTLADIGESQAYRDVWAAAPDKKPQFTQFEQNSYRAIFKRCKEITDLDTIASLGGSQTRNLTILITKLICFLGGFSFEGVDVNTRFDAASATEALKAVPNDLRDLVKVDTTNSGSPKDTQATFRQWLTKQQLSEKTVESYAKTVPQLIDSIYRVKNPGFLGVLSTYDISALDVVSWFLSTDEKWIAANNTGNGMYNAGLKKYREYLVSFAPHCSLPKNFLLLAGISGTGKSRFVRVQSEKSFSEESYQLIPVRPDWHEPSDLLGYVSRIGDTKYVPTAFLIFLARAWKAAFDASIGSELTLKPLNQIPTFWVCLDEMNLAPVEQYFADYLSVVETRKWVGDQYSCDPLVRPRELLMGEKPDVLNSMKASLGLDGFDDLWNFFLEAGIPLPPNLVVAGTVNMDETTHGFSRKVIDRALTFDFGNFFPNDFDKYFGDQNLPKTLAFSRYSKATLDDLKAWVPADEDGKKSTGFLKDINTILKDTPFELAYRALNELLVSLLCFKPKTEKELLAVWDDFLMCKLLPRLEGDEDKFRKNGTDVLDALLTLVQSKFPVEAESPTPRPDLLNTTHNGKELLIAYRSPAKLQWMKNRLSGGFTSFWP